MSRFDEDCFEVGGGDECLYDVMLEDARHDYEPEWMPELDPPPQAELGEDFP